MTELCLDEFEAHAGIITQSKNLSTPSVNLEGKANTRGINPTL